MSASDARAPVGEARELGGRYRLVRYIAKGGMAEVWEGYDNVLSRPVAVKILFAHLATDAMVLERFRREAVTAARLSHPGVIATYDTGVDHGTAWIVMELVRGRTLRSLMNELGPMEPALAVRIAGQVTDALAHAHKHGLVHRDVKPGNVLLCDEEGPVPRAKVTDFGIAKAAEGLGGLDLTKTGIVLGTPKYLSPEQVEGMEPDARADLYSLGVVLFEMLTGQPPFTGPTDMAVALAHLRVEPPRVWSLQPAVPDEVDDIVAGLLVKDREQRTPSAVALRQELAAAARHLGDVRARGAGQGGATSSTPAISGGVGAGQQQPWPGASRDRTPGTTTGSRRTANGWGPPAAAGHGGGRRSPTPPAMPRPTGAGVAGAAATAAAGGVTRERPADRRGDLSTRVDGARVGPGGTAAMGRTAPPGDPVANGRTAPPASRRPPASRPSRSRGPGLVVASLVVIGVVILGFLLARISPSSGSPSSTGGSTSPLAIAAASELVPPSHTQDNPGELQYLTDGDLSTSWSTERYRTADFGGLYPGLGVILQLSGSHTLQHLTVTSPTQGWAAQAYVASDEPSASASVGGWGQPTASESDIGGNVTLSLNGRRGSWVLLWLTDLGPARQITIDEVAVS